VTLEQPGGPRDGREVSPGLAALLSIAGGPVDLTVAWRRDQLRKWLNKWVCRLRYPHPADPVLFSNSVAQWWGNQQVSLTGLPNRRTQRLRGCDTR
jgi:hypothetical protein